MTSTIFLRLAQRFEELCLNLGVELHPRKWAEGRIPRQILKHLGAELDLMRSELRMPEGKIDDILTIIQRTKGKRVVRLKDFQSLVGMLCYAASFSEYAKTFLRNCFDAIRDANRRRSRYALVNREVRSDLTWFQNYWKRFNGVPFHRNSTWITTQDHCVSTDASNFGYGAFNSKTGEYFHGTFTANLQRLPIHVLEMLVLYAAVMAWGDAWQGRSVVFDVDNVAVVQTVNSHYSRDPSLMVFLRALFEQSHKLSAEFRCRHIRTNVNVCADALSRNDLLLFRQHAFILSGFTPEKLTRIHLNPQVWSRAQQALSAFDRPTLLSSQGRIPAKIRPRSQVAILRHGNGNCEDRFGRI